jgi:hypothetical protein
VVGDDKGVVHLLDARSGLELRAWTLSGDLAGVSISGDARRIAAAGEAGAWLIDLGSGAVRRLENSSGMLWSIHFSRDGKLLVSGGLWTQVWNGLTGEPLVQIPGDRRTPFAFFGEDSRKLFSFGLTARREELIEDTAPPERQLAEVLVRYRLKLVGQRVVEDGPAPQP